MAERLGLIGLPFSGKTTVLQTVCNLTADHVHAAGELGEHVGTMKSTGDERLAWLAELMHSKKRTPLSLEVWDFPGFDLSSEPGRHMARRLIAEVRQCDALVIVLRAFSNEAVPVYRDRVDPAGDLAELLEEFAFADMDQITRRIEKLEDQIRKPTPSRDQHKKELDLLKRCLSRLEDGKTLDDLAHNEDEAKMLRGFALLAQHPCVVIVNTDEDKHSETVALPSYPSVKCTLVSAVEYERQLEELPSGERQAFFDEAGITELLADRLSTAALRALDSIMFYTVGENEARAWTLPAGTRAVEAAGKIHTDIARGFIRAETINYDELKKCGSYKQARSEGKLRLEGKDYTICDGDVVLFRFNV